MKIANMTQTEITAVLSRRTYFRPGQTLRNIGYRTETLQNTNKNILNLFMKNSIQNIIQKPALRFWPRYKWTKKVLKNVRENAC